MENHQNLLYPIPGSLYCMVIGGYPFQ